MNAFVLLIPIILIRYMLLSWISKTALHRAAFLPPVEGKEKLALVVYQVTLIVMFIYLIFLKIELEGFTNYIGLGIYLIGTVLYAISIIDYAKPKESGINLNGLYNLSRNPMYVAFFLYFLGCSMLTESWLFFIILIIFQISVHYIILSEERWCYDQFGNDYQYYVKRVRRYI